MRDADHRRFQPVSIQTPFFARMYICLGNEYSRILSASPSRNRHSLNRLKMRCERIDDGIENNVLKNKWRARTSRATNIEMMVLRKTITASRLHHAIEAVEVEDVPDLFIHCK